MVEPSLDGNKAQYVRKLIESGYALSVGPFVEQFETEFTDIAETRHEAARNSGTAALHATSRLVNPAPGRLVETSGYTSIASANVITYTSAQVPLVEREPTVGNMDSPPLHEGIILRAHRTRTASRRCRNDVRPRCPARMERPIEPRTEFAIVLAVDGPEALGARWLAGAVVGARCQKCQHHNQA